MSDDPQNEPLDEIVGVRMTSSQKEAVRASAGEVDRSMSDYVREAVFEAEVAPRSPVPEVNRELDTEMAAVGSNINQIARRLHQLTNLLAELGDEQRVDKLRGLEVHLLEVQTELDSVRDMHDKIREDLHGAEPVRAAADALDRYALAAMSPRIDEDSNHLKRLAAELHAFAKRQGDT